MDDLLLIVQSLREDYKQHRQEIKEDLEEIFNRIRDLELKQENSIGKLQGSESITTKNLIILALIVQVIQTLVYAGLRL